MEHHLVAGFSQNRLGIEAHPAQERIVGLDNPVSPGIDDHQIIGDAVDNFFAEFIGGAQFFFHLFEMGDVGGNADGAQKVAVNHEGAPPTPG